jgi:hypothetical protein
MFSYWDWAQAYHPSRIHRDNPGLELTVPVADEYLTGTLKCPVLWNTENLCNSKYPFKLQIKFYFLFSKKIEIF